MAMLTDSNLELYLQICADSYGEDKSTGNPLDNSWQKLNLVIDGVVTDKNYFNFNELFYELNGFDAAIYYNSITQDVIIGIRGTEPDANDGDVLESR